MKRLVFLLGTLLPVAAAQPGPPQQPSIKPTDEETRQIQSKTAELDALVHKLKAKRGNEDLVADVEVYAKAARMLLEFPEDFFTQDGIDHALAVLDTGLERAHQLPSGQSPWTAKTKRIHGYRSALDGSLQPYGVTVPASYDATKSVRLYVWMHGRAQRLTEADFLFNFPNQGPSKPPVADAGQIQLDLYGRWNGGGWHYAGEVDVFEAMAAVRKRYKIDPSRILLRGFSMAVRARGTSRCTIPTVGRPRRLEPARGRGGRKCRALRPITTRPLHLGEFHRVGAERFQYASSRARRRQ
jgi:hypothetical protein